MSQYRTRMDWSPAPEPEEAAVIPSMSEAAKIRDVAARHAYVFDNGLSSPDFYDVDKHLQSEECRLLRAHCDPSHRVLEVGCFTGRNLIGLERDGFENLTGLDFVPKAIEWANDHSRSIDYRCGTFPECLNDGEWDRIVCFDVLEHQLNVGAFLQGMEERLAPGGRVLMIVPKGRHYFDCGHVAFFPDCECLTNVLDYYFEVESANELKTVPKLFAVCSKRS